MYLILFVLAFFFLLLSCLRFRIIVYCCCCGSFLTELRKVCHHWKNDDETRRIRAERNKSEGVEIEGEFILRKFLANATNNFKYEESLVNYLINLFCFPVKRHAMRRWLRHFSATFEFALEKRTK